MERQEQQIKQLQEPTASEDQTQATTAEADHEEPVTPTPLQRFRALLDSAKRGQSPVTSRRELGRDKSKSLLVLGGASVALLLLFFGLFSSPKNRGPLPGETARGGPSLGRKVPTGQEQNDPAKTVTPLLSADVNRGDVSSGSQVTAEDVGGTSPRYNGTRNCQVETPLCWKSLQRAEHEVQENMPSRTWISQIPKLRRQSRFPIHLHCTPVRQIPT